MVGCTRVTGFSDTRLFEIIGVTRLFLRTKCCVMGCCFWKEGDFAAMKNLISECACSYRGEGREVCVCVSWLAQSKVFS